MVIWMFVKVPDLLPDAGAPAGSDDRLLSGTPGSIFPSTTMLLTGLLADTRCPTLFLASDASLR